MRVLRLVVHTMQLSLLRVGIGWMFALLSFNFNRITIADLGALGLLVGTLVGLHHFLSPFQVFWGRLADRFPLAGYRRTPYIALSALLGSLVFLLLPRLAVGLGTHSPLAIVASFGVFVVFGLAMAANGATTFALIAEVTTERERGIVVAVSHTFTIVSAIVSAGVAKAVMPEYDPQQMQLLYNLTPVITLCSLLFGLPFLERRLSRQEHAELLAAAAPTPASTAHQHDPNAFQLAWGLLQDNPQLRGFFLFMVLGIMGIFLQDAILEVFGKEVFAMSVEATTTFTQTWGGGVLIGMLLIGLLTVVSPVSKKLLAITGGCGTALGFVLLAVAAARQHAPLVTPALFLMGFSVGMFNVGALSLMMDMAVPGQTGLYMGLWGMAQGFATGFANILGTGLHTALIETGWLLPHLAYTLIFGLEAALMLAAIIILRGISVQACQHLTPGDMSAALAMDTAG